MFTMYVAKTHAFVVTMKALNSFITRKIGDIISIQSIDIYNI